MKSGPKSCVEGRGRVIKHRLVFEVLHSSVLHGDIPIRMKGSPAWVHAAIRTSEIHLKQEQLGLPPCTDIWKPLSCNIQYRRAVNDAEPLICCHLEIVLIAAENCLS